MIGSEPTQPSDRSDRRAYAVLVMLSLIAAVPFVVLVVHALGLRYHASSDLALLELRVRDVGSLHTPLVGAFSRFHWNHPGPWLFYALAPPYRAFGSDGPAVLAANVVLNGAFLAGAIALLWQRGRAGGLALGLVVLLVLTRALGGEFLLSPWNPYLDVLPLLVLVLVVWSIACGDAWLLPACVGLACWSVLTHVGATPIAATGLVASVAMVVVATRRGTVRRPRRVWLGSLAVGVVMWIPPLVDATRARGGNLGALWRYFTAHHPDITGWSRAARIVLVQFGIPAPWMTGHEAVAGFGGGGLDPAWQIPWALIMVGVAAVVARRRRDRPAWSLCLVTVGLAAVAWISTAQVVGEPFSYLVRWTWLVGATAWLAIGWTGWGVARASVEGPVPRRTGLVAFGAIAIGFAIATTVGARNSQPLFRDSSLVVGGVEAATVAAARHAPGPVLVEPAPDFDSLQATNGVVLALDQAGITAGRTPDFAWQTGRAHVVARSAARTTYLVAVNASVDRYREDPRYRPVAEYDALSETDRAEVERIRALQPRGTTNDLAAIQRWIRRHPSEWKRFTRLEARGDRAVVYELVGD